MANDTNREKSIEARLEITRKAVVTRSQAIHTLREVADLFINDGALIRGVAILRCIEVITGEPYRPKPKGGADVVSLPAPSKPTG